MATKKAEDAASIQSPEDLVEVHIPIKNKDDPNFFVSINDQTWLMPRGTTQKVPRYVADEIRRAEKADQARYMNQLELLEKSAQ